MANLYGVANAPGQPVSYTMIGGADIVCNIGVETNVFDSGLVTAPSQGFFYPLAWVNVVFSTGATPPGGLQYGLRVNNGADQFNVGLSTVLIGANGNYMFSFTLVGTPSQALYQGAGSHVQVSLTAATQAITARTAGSYALITLYRAQDQ